MQIVQLLVFAICAITVVVIDGPRIGMTRALVILFAAAMLGAFTGALLIGPMLDMTSGPSAGFAAGALAGTLIVSEIRT